MIFLHAVTAGIRAAAAMRTALLLVLAAQSVSPSSVMAADQADRPPNIVFILIDDLGWRDLGFMGSDFFETPHIDRLSTQGMVFSQAYSNAPNCAPTRAALMSGQYAPRTGVYSVNSSERGKAQNRRLIPIPNKLELDPEVVTLAEVLKGAGYITGAIGKWHLGTTAEYLPQAQGFDEVVMRSLVGHTPSYFSPYEVRNLPAEQRGGYLTTDLTNEAIGFMKSHREEPFFLYLSYHTVHTPIQPEPHRVPKYEEKPPGGLHQHTRYAAMVEGMDAYVGQVLDAIDALGLTDDTIVVFTSDNGGHGSYTNMTPLRGSKGMVYEGGIRVPLVVRWPGRVEAGARSDTPVITFDFYPTLAAAAGAALPTEQPIDGENLLPLLTHGESPKRESLYWHFPAYLQAWPGLKVGPWRATPCSVVRQGDFKLIEFFEDGHVELYNLASDPGESFNLTEMMPDKARELHADLAAWRQQIGAPVPTELNPKFDAAPATPSDATATDPADTLDRAQTDRPNIIYILADDLGYGELGSYGQQKIHTPNLDTLASEGMRFTQHYSGSPVCAPARCVLMTGLHAGHSYIRNNSPWARNENPHGEGQEPIPTDTVTVAKLLQEQGYSTSCIGKWGLGGPETTGAPNQQGFDHFFGYLCQAQAHNYYPGHLWRNGEKVDLQNNPFSAHQRVAETPSDYDKYNGNEYAPDLMIGEALRFIRDKQSQPFFLFYATPVPHAALQVPDEELDAYPTQWDTAPYLGKKGYLPHPRPRAAYAGMISRMDDHIGQILDLLNELELTDNTIVIFSSDNGPTFNGGSDSKFFQSTGPLRGLKGSVFEGGIRVPMIARWPGRIEAGQISNHVSAFSDVLPTIVELAGGAPPRRIDGVSMVPTLLGHAENQVRHEAMYWELGRRQAVRQGDWKLVRQVAKDGSVNEMLFDLRTDVGETTNVAGEHPEILNKLRALARSMRTPAVKFASPYDDGR